MLDLVIRQLPGHLNGDFDKVSVVPSFQRMTQPETTPANANVVRPRVDSGGLQTPEFIKTVAELADPMQSETIKGWLLSNLRAPN